MAGGQREMVVRLHTAGGGGGRVGRPRGGGGGGGDMTGADTDCGMNRNAWPRSASTTASSFPLHFAVFPSLSLSLSLSPEPLMNPLADCSTPTQIAAGGHS